MVRSETILDDFSRYVIAWKLCTGMTSRDVTETLEHYFLPGDLEKQIESFVDHYNHQRYHESSKNLKTADVYLGCGQSKLASRKRIKKRTIAKRRLHDQRYAA